MKILEKLRAKHAATTEERDALAAAMEAIATLADDETRDATPEEAEQVKEHRTKIVALDAELDELEREIEVYAKIEERTNRAANAPTFIRKPDTPTPVDVARMGYGEARSAALRQLDDEDVETRVGDQVTKVINTRNADTDGDYIAKRLLITESDAYRSAFTKGVSGHASMWTDDEKRAMNALMDLESRAASSTAASGGYGVPVLIDPTIILTSGAIEATLLSYCRIETITTDAWKGVSSTAAAWSTDAEASAVSDDMTTLAQPTVTVYEARAFIPYSIRIGMDYPNFVTEMGALIEQGYIDYLASKTIVGPGSTDITGLFTALDANTNVEVVVTTDGAFGDVDIDKVWKALQKRFKRNAVWVASVGVENKIRGFGSGTATSRFTVDQTREGISLLNGKVFLTDDYAPDFTGTTGAANILVVGDPKNYLVAQRAGMTVEYIQNLFDVTNNRPTGQRGLFAWARVGGNSINDNAFRLLQNQ